jgi:hypothetical protein
MLDFVLQGAVFVIRFDRHHLITVFRDLSFNGADLGLEFFAASLIVFRFFLGRFETGLRGSQLFIEGFGACREFVNPGSEFLDRNVDRLEADELLEI